MENKNNTVGTVPKANKLMENKNHNCRPKAINKWKIKTMEHFKTINKMEKLLSEQFQKPINDGN